MRRWCFRWLRLRRWDTTGAWTRRPAKLIELDALLDDVSAAGMAEQRRVYVHWRDRFREETPDWPRWELRMRLTGGLIDDQIGLSLLEIDQIQNYKHNPTVYVELLGLRCFSR